MSLMKDALIDHISSCEECSERNDRIYDFDTTTVEEANELLIEIEECYEDNIADIDTKASLFSDQARGTL